MCRNGNLLAGFWVAPRPSVFVSEFKVAESRELNRFAILKALPNLLEEEIDELFRLPLVQAELFEESFSQLRFRERHVRHLNLTP